MDFFIKPFNYESFIEKIKQENLQTFALFKKKLLYIARKLVLFR